MSHVLVTGGAGFIGSHLCARLLDAGHRVTVLDDFSSGSERNLAAVLDRITVLRDDVLHLERHADALADVTAIVHLAARISGYESLWQPDDYIATNITATQRVLAFAGRLASPRIVFASSSTIYGNGTDPLRSETTPPAPITMYALSKLAGEHMLSMYANLHGYTWNALRLFNVYGPHQSPDHPYANVTCKFAHAAATGGAVKLYGDGEQSRDFVYIDDVVDALLRALTSPQHGGIYNIGTGQTATIRALLDIAGELAGAPLPCERCDPWPNDIRSIRADITLASTALGFTPTVPLSQGLSRTVAWFRGLGDAS
jgi:nucleoside-diphosphate-sugar epimerase